MFIYETILHSASSTGSVDLVQFLIGTDGICLNPRDFSEIVKFVFINKTIFHSACKSGSLNLVKFLVSKDLVDINAITVVILYIYKVYTYILIKLETL